MSKNLDETLKNRTNANFDALLKAYITNSGGAWNSKMYDFIYDLARLSTGYSHASHAYDSADYLGAIFNDSFSDDDSYTYDYDDNLLSTTKERFEVLFYENLNSLDLISLGSFSEFYNDFCSKVDYKGTKEDFQTNLQKSIVFQDQVYEQTIAYNG